jgi:HEAT repeat protein
MSSIIQQAIIQLRSEEYETWIQGWRTLFFLRDPSAVEELLAALNDAHARVRETAVIALGQIPDSRSTEPLITVLDDPIDEVSSHAAWALAEIGDKRAVEPIIRALNKPNCVDTQRLAIKALAKLGDNRAVEPLIDLLRRTYISHVATILGNMGDCRAVEPLIQLLSAEADGKEYGNQNLSFRYYSVRALGKLGDLRALPLLEKIVEQETQPLLKRKSVSDMAKIAISRIQDNKTQAELSAA